ncbi:MAG: tRNA preQ1(34) S-adenosylmethionine ribosyltransferase-isomerase QueA [Opitutales bacterium]|nr:tRNA preQ1(34) S-adenosylmethionine ribosyltransferase-isomerase QueA [Opitutales bacterium]
MDSSLFDYELPPERIAQCPADKRDESRLIVVRRGCAKPEHALFKDLPEFLPARTRLFRNDVSVLKARLRGQRLSGGAVECLLLNPGEDSHKWWCMLRPGKKLKIGSHFILAEGARATVLDKADEGRALVQFDLPARYDVQSFASAHGEIPLPPYIQREHSTREDETRYQTTFADPSHLGAVAAPTAGLHFTPEVDAELLRRGHELLPLTLNVGIGTFKPIQTDSLEEHKMHSERYFIPSATVAALADASRPRLAVGTTSLRSIEDFSRKGARPGPDGAYVGDAQLFIYPPSTFHVEHMLTNFHLPRSTLLCLVSAFLTPGSTDGIKWMLEIYKEAIDLKYRFFSYGDAMLIL